MNCSVTLCQDDKVLLIFSDHTDFGVVSYIAIACMTLYPLDCFLLEIRDFLFSKKGALSTNVEEFCTRSPFGSTVHLITYH